MNPAEWYGVVACRVRDSLMRGLAMKFSTTVRSIQ